MLLILTTTTDVTADYLCGELEQACRPFLRLNTDDCLPRLRIHYSVEEIQLEVDGRQFSPDSFSHVWYRRPERLRHLDLTDAGEGAYILDEWTEALEALLCHIPKPKWMNHPTSNVIASRKLYQLSIARECGLKVPATLVTQDDKALRSFRPRHRWGIVAKPMAAGYIERDDTALDSVIYTALVPDEELQDLSDLRNCPTLFQEYINKRSDVRITVVDDEQVAVELRAVDGCGLQRCDIRRYNMHGVTYRQIVPPPEVSEGIRELLRRFNLRFAAVDMVVGPEDEWYFLEVNPNGQWAWLDLVGETRIADLFIRAFATPRI